MKQKLLLACTLILVVTGAQAQNQSESTSWKPYTIKDEKFSVALPTLPALHTRQTWRDQDKKDRQERALGCYADGVVYTVYVVENPKPRQSLNSFIEEQTAPYSASYHSSESNPIVDGFTGMTRTSSGGDGMSQFFAAEDRLYAFRAFGAPQEDPRITKFFSSISLRKRNDALEVLDGPGGSYENIVQAKGPVGDEKPQTGKQVDKKVRLGTKPQPSYTEDAKRHSIAGTVVLRCVFASNGTVTRISVLSGLPYGLTEKAIDAARKIKFIPAMKDGKYVSMWMQLEYNFNLY